MKSARLLPLLLPVVAVALLASWVIARALAPTSVTKVSNLMSGTVTGLDRGDSARMHLEKLAAGQVVGRGEVVQRFDVASGRWHRHGLALPAGYYRLVPEAEDYVHVPRSITFQVPDKGIFWRYQALDFRFIHPKNAAALLGLPLCPDDSSPVVPVTPVPEGTPGPTPEPGLVPSGPCYANHLADARLVPAGLQGSISGLSEGQSATISLYALPPVPGEQYGEGEPPPTDSNWSYPPEVTGLEESPEIAADWPLRAMLRTGNGPWGLVDPSLVGAKYLVTASAPGLKVDPPAYEVVIFAGKAPGFPGGVDFAFGP